MSKPDGAQEREWVVLIEYERYGGSSYIFHVPDAATAADAIRAARERMTLGDIRTVRRARALAVDDLAEQPWDRAWM